MVYCGCLHPRQPKSVLYNLSYVLCYVESMQRPAYLPAPGLPSHVAPMCGRVGYGAFRAPGSGFQAWNIKAARAVTACGAEGEGERYAVNEMGVRENRRTEEPKNQRTKGPDNQITKEFSCLHAFLGGAQRAPHGQSAPLARFQPCLAVAAAAPIITTSCDSTTRSQLHHPPVTNHASLPL